MKDSGEVYGNVVVSEINGKNEHQRNTEKFVDDTKNLTKS